MPPGKESNSHLVRAQRGFAVLVPSTLQARNPIEDQYPEDGSCLACDVPVGNWLDMEPLRMRHHLQDTLSRASSTWQMWRKSMDRDRRPDHAPVQKSALIRAT